MVKLGKLVSYVSMARVQKNLLTFWSETLEIVATNHEQWPFCCRLWNQNDWIIRICTVRLYFVVYREVLFFSTCAGPLSVPVKIHSCYSSLQPCEKGSGQLISRSCLALNVDSDRKPLMSIDSFTSPESCLQVDVTVLILYTNSGLWFFLDALHTWV